MFVSVLESGTVFVVGKIVGGDFAVKVTILRLCKHGSAELHVSTIRLSMKPVHGRPKAVYVGGACFLYVRLSWVRQESWWPREKIIVPSYARK